MIRSTAGLHNLFRVPGYFNYIMDELDIDRIMQFDASAQGGRVVHMDYYALLDNPVSALRSIHAGLGIDSPDQIIESVAQWQCANPKNARGRNDYTLEQWGLDADAVAERFSEYMRRFDIPREQAGLARNAL